LIHGRGVAVTRLFRVERAGVNLEEIGGENDNDDDRA
jgi:hypothetical protein